MENELIVSITLTLCGIVALVAALNDIRYRRVHIVLPLVILTIGLISSLILERLLLFVESLIFGGILTYLLWIIGAIGGGDAKIMATLFAILRSINPHAGETMVYITFAAALIKIYFEKKSVLRERIAKKIEDEFSRKNIIRIVKLFFILSSMLIPMQLISQIFWTAIPGILLIGWIIWLIYNLFGKIGEFSLITMGIITTIIEIINGFYKYIVLILIITLTLVLLRIPIIIAFPDADQRKIPLYNPFYTRNTAKIKNFIPLGPEMFIGYIISVILVIINII